MYNEKDALLYAVGIGAQELHFTYELSEAFSVFPTMPVVWNSQPHSIKSFGGSNPKKKAAPSKWGMFGPGIPKFPTAMLLHGEQYVEITKPLPLKGKFTTKTRNVGVHDKGKGCVLENQTDDDGRVRQRDLQDGRVHVHPKDGRLYRCG
jgi:hypothetical protein